MTRIDIDEIGLAACENGFVNRDGVVVNPHIVQRLLDLDFDRRERLHSVATRFGEQGVFWGARILHAATVGLLIAVGVLLDVGPVYWLGVFAVAALLVYEHSIVRPGDLRRLDMAFFTLNGIISLTFFAFVLVDAIL